MPNFKTMDHAMSSDAPSLRNRYSQFLVLLLMSAFMYVMVQSIRSGVNNFQDNFYKKYFLIEKITLLRMNLGDRLFAQALIGKDGWMHYTGEGTIEDFQGLRSFDNRDEFGKLKILDQYLKSQGITLLFVVAPNKTSIYPETLPDEMIYQPASTLDSLISYLEDNDLPILDLRPALKAARKERDVYYKTDTHWNGYGAFIAYTTIVNKLRESHPQLSSYRASDLQLKTTSADILEISGMLGITTIKESGPYFTSSENLVQTIHPGDYNRYDQLSWIPNSTLPTLLMFHDSFGAKYLNAYLSMNFSTSHFVHVESMSKYLTKEVIQQLEPDIIIIEIVERNLQDIPFYYPYFLLE
jgi:alginate O-acetyltransferase complex protein AlgJ